jgi:long-chain acyl-CoA synthetase
MSTISRTGADTNLIHGILRVALEHPARRALVDAHDDSSCVTYGELRQGILRRAQYFLDHGLRPGHLAVLNLDGASRIDELLAFLALTGIGVGVYASSVKLDAERQVAERLEIGHEIVSDPAIRTPRKKIVVPRHDAFPTMPDGDNLSDVTVADALGLPWLVRSTSGTTGDPKVFITRHGQAVFRRERYYSATGLASDSVFLTLTSIRFGAARQRVFYALSQGASVVIQPEDATVDSVIETARNRKVTHLYCVPMHLALCCQVARISGAPLGPPPLLPDLVNLESSSSVVTAELARSVRSLVSPGFSNSYAASEVGHISSTRLCPETEQDAALSNIGRAVEGVEIAIVDEQLKPVPPGTRGLIAVRFTGRPTEVAYLDARRQWVSETRNGYFLPGDIGYVSQTGNLIFECRADDMMICDGINIYPREIESVLEAHPAVAEAAAFPVSSAVHGSIPVAAVTLRSAVSGGQELVDYCRVRLGSRAPAHVAVMAALPRNHLGKILKRELAAMFREA